MVYKPFSIATLATACIAATFAQEETVELDPLYVTASRIDPSADSLQLPVSSFELQSLESGQFRDISDALTSYPGFSSYRRTHATSAHPTTQGVRLRNVGANATSRALVLYNGVPQNDPFGSWVYWHQFDLAQLEHLSIYPGGSGELWGNMASGGVISLISESGVPGSSSIQASIGTSDRYDLHAQTSQSLSNDAVFELGLRTFATDGFHTLREDQRGPVDVPANSEATVANARLSFGNADTGQHLVSFRYFDEERSNGTPVTQNDTESLDLAYITEQQIGSGDARLNVNAYYQDRQFRNVFSSVSDDRTSERPALEQYDVPAESYGAALIFNSDTSESLPFSAGVDYRMVEGAVNERYRNLGDGFTRDRFAGGSQSFIGAFITAAYEASPADQVALSLRVDRARQFDGTRIERDTTNDTVILEESYPDRKDELLSANLNWSHELSEDTLTNLSLFSGFRAPTLNELYRPYRVRNDITEANPSLTNERMQGAELSLAHQPSETRSLRISAFAYDLHEIIANALITTESGFDPRFGFIPEGGSGSIRSNLNESQVSGMELHVRDELTDSLSTWFSAVYAKTEIDSDELDPFVGNAFPQSAPWRAAAGMEWTGQGPWSAWARYLWSDRTYENLTNTIRIGATGDLSFGAAYRFDEHTSLSLTVTNALDEQNVTGIASNGLVTIDEPREFLLTLNWSR